MNKRVENGDEVRKQEKEKETREETGAEKLKTSEGKRNRADGGV
jgi:hypothetical protein